MAIVHRADLRPSKLELLAAWLPTQDWFSVDGEIERVAAFRLDDPAGEVGVETFIVRNDSGEFHVPLTYRAAPLAEGQLVGEMEHSVLGHRWVYDGPSDPVYVAVTSTAILEAGSDVDMVWADGAPVPRQEWFATVVGTGPVAGSSPGSELQVARALPGEAPAGVPRLTASWPGQPSPLTLAWLA